MANYLALDDWKKLLKKQKDAKDVAGIEACLKEFAEEQEEENEEGQAKALAALAKAAKDAAKKTKSDEIADYLDGMAKEAEKQSKKLAAQASKADEDESDEEEDEDDDNAALGVMFTKVKKRKPEKALNFVIAVGKPSGIVITKKALSATHTKAAKEMRDGQGAILEGRCFGDGKACIFELSEAPPRGLAKRIKSAALAHTELKIKVKVRGGGIELDDETDADEMEGDASQTIPQPPPPPSPPPTGSSVPPAPPSPPAANETKPSELGSVAYAKLLLAFDGAKKKLHADLTALEQKILKEFEGDADLAEVRQHVRRLDSVLARFDDTLKDLFDDALNVTPAERTPLHQQALATIEEYQTYLSQDSFLQDIASNPFEVPISVKLMSDTLKVMATRLA